MTTPAPTPIPAPHFPVTPAILEVDLVGAVMASIGARTATTYAADYRDFARYLDAPTPAAALEGLVALPHGAANAVALGYRVHLTDRKLAPGTIARRLTALRMAVRVARQLGLITWALDVTGPKAESYRDTTGPGKDGWLAMLSTAKAEATTGDPRAVRNLALIRLLHDLALRRSEAIGIDLADVDLEAGTVAVVGKGKSAPTPMTLSRQAVEAIAAWLDFRGTEAGPLFVRLDRGAVEPTRLTGEAVRLVVAELAKRAGVGKVVRPHGLRHQGITQALDATGGNVRDVQRFSRHAKIETLMLYDDRRVDVAGQIAQMVADDE